MKRLNYAIIGCGRISPNHFIAAKENNLNIVGLCDLELGNIAQSLKRAGLDFPCERYTNYKEMLLKEKPDLVAIATESGKHAEIAIDCLHAGCNVIIEKPMALSISDADLIIELAKEKKLKISACHQNRFNKAIQEIKSAIDKGRFGKLLHGSVHVRWSRDKNYYDQAKWRGTWEQDGGALMNQCIHGIDLLRWLMGGEIIEVVGFIDRLNHKYISAEDLGMALIRFKNGAYGVLEGTTNVYPKNLEESLFIFGEKGTAKIGGESTNRIEDWRFGDELDDPEAVKRITQEMPPNVYGYGHTKLYADMIDAIINNRTPYVDGQAGKDALELVLAVYKASLTGSHIRLPLSDFGTGDMKRIFTKDNKLREF